MINATPTIELNLYGKLRRLVPESGSIGVNRLNIPVNSNDTVASILARFEITTDQIYTVFVNHKLLATRSKMVEAVEMIQAQADIHAWKLDLPLHGGDQLGLFGDDMAILF
jgi:hypothetical protein